MSWVKLDDLFPENWKIEPLSDAAFRAQVTALCYCNRQLTDGFLPEKTARTYAKPKIIEELLKPRSNPVTGEASACWERVEGGYQLHHYLDYQPSRAYTLEKRAADSARKLTAESRRNPGGIQTDSSRPRGRPVPSRPVPSDPDPPPPPPPLAADKPQRERARQLSEADIAQLIDDFPTVDVLREAAKYRDWLQAKGAKTKDHVARFRNWLRKAEDDAKAKRDPVAASSGSGDRYSQAADRLEARLKG